jgi:hypothetical protein
MPITVDNCASPKLGKTRLLATCRVHELAEGQRGTVDRGPGQRGRRPPTTAPAPPRGTHGAHRARLTELKRYGQPRPGRRISIYANPAYVWIVVAGIALDTADYGGPAVPAGSGPRWRAAPLATSTTATLTVYRAASGAAVRRRRARPFRSLLTSQRSPLWHSTRVPF